MTLLVKRRLIIQGADHVKNNCYQKQCCCGVNENVHDHEMTPVNEEVPVEGIASSWNQVSELDPWTVTSKRSMHVTRVVTKNDEVHVSRLRQTIRKRCGGPCINKDAA